MADTVNATVGKKQIAGIVAVMLPVAVMAMSYPPYGIYTGKNTKWARH